MDNKLILYPSNWLYNAGVIGFLRVLEFGKEKNKNTNFYYKINEDGNVVISNSIIKESYMWIFDYHTQKLNENFSIWGRNRRYPNYIQSSQRDFFENHYVNALVKLTYNPKKICSWCNGYFLPDDELQTLQQKYPGNEESFSRFMEQREKFQGIHIKELGAAITKMPNAFWNLETSIPICHFCSYLVIFHHLAFNETREYQIFINTPNFLITWDLNNFIEKILQIPREYSLRKLLSSSLIEWAIKQRALLGAWTMMNIEIIVKRWNKEEKEWIIDYFDLPYHVTRILLDYEIASLIKRINEEKIFDLILSGKFSEIEKAAYFVLRGILKLKNNERISENDPITKYISNYKDLDYLKKISSLLPELYGKIMKILNQTKGG